MKRQGRRKSGGTLLKAFFGPVGLVVLTLAVIFGVGWWVKNRDGDTPAVTENKPATQPPAAQPTQPAQPATPPQTQAQTPAAPVVNPNQAILDKRAHIDRSNGAQQTMLVMVYYVDGLTNGEQLQPVEVRIPASPSRIKVTAEQVVQAPGDELKLYSSFPAGTKVQSVDLDNGVARVDLNAEAAKVQGSAAVNDIQASLVYSLTEIPGVKSVQLLVNGRPAMLHGMEWSKPISRADLQARKLYAVEPAIRFK